MGGLTGGRFFDVHGNEPISFEANERLVLGLRRTYQKPGAIPLVM